MTTGGLPAGSYIYLGDLDNGSGTETFTAQAFNAAHVPLTTAWLDTAISIYGSGVGPGGLPAVTDTPAWSYNASTATYTFDGSGVPGNPAVAVLLPTNQGIAEMDVFRDTSSASYAIQAPAAPVPEPATMGLLMLTGVAVVGRRRFRRM